MANAIDFLVGYLYVSRLYVLSLHEVVMGVIVAGIWVGLLTPPTLFRQRCICS